MTTTQNPPSVPFLDEKGRVSREWWKFLYNLNSSTNSVADGTIETASGSGLAGGGAVAGGVSLSIANNGVTNSMIRQSSSTSVMGRPFGSSGNVSDIVATGDNQVLTRAGGLLGFTSSIDGLTLGTITACPLVRTDSLELTGTPAASTAVADRSIPIECDGTTYYLLLSTTP